MPQKTTERHKIILFKGKKNFLQSGKMATSVCSISWKRLRGRLDSTAQLGAWFSGLSGEMLVNSLLPRLELDKLYLLEFIPSYTTLLL